jgi:bifunctional DNA-binding transcriptional regulator/antitoxin component of YhaV-PrlF toxin-antitoxin module
VKRSKRVKAKEKGKRVQIPKLVRWKHKLEPSQVLKVSVATNSAFGWERFYARMDKSGRITIPKLTLKLLQEKTGKQDLAGTILEVMLNPACKNFV